MKEKTRFERLDEAALRGGSWLSDFDLLLRTYYLGWSLPYGNPDNQGFRCVCREDSPIAQRLVRIK